MRTKPANFLSSCLWKIIKFIRRHTCSVYNRKKTFIIFKYIFIKFIFVYFRCIEILFKMMLIKEIMLEIFFDYKFHTGLITILVKTRRGHWISRRNMSCCVDEFWTWFDLCSFLIIINITSCAPFFFQMLTKQSRFQSNASFDYRLNDICWYPRFQFTEWRLNIIRWHRLGGLEPRLN
jgi:hypothetical protein